MKTMSDFIMEQDVVTAAQTEEVTDVEIMESFMKMNAVAAVVDCYIEHAAIASFAESENLNVFTESADDVKEKKDNVFKRMFTAIFEWFKKLIGAIATFLGANKLDACIKKLEKMAEKNGKDGGKLINMDAEFESSVNYARVDVLLKAIQDFVDGFNATSPDKNITLAAIKSSVEKIEKLNDNYGQGAGKVTWNDVLADLKRLKENNAFGKSKELMKKIDEVIKKQRDNANANALALDKEVSDALKSATKSIAKAYDKFTKNVAKLTSKLADTEMQKAKQAQESAEVDTEGYNFL